ncbi:MAG: DNA repair protein RecN [Tannerellaceae bacterium]|jgi:DNA repair protein RecN (Recombination protein N)|nr:DNA repair protein RecN [Tannerellaceae bacterium]
MLKSLLIQNYVLIDSLDIRPSDTFTVITGETGAGKSIILGALSIVLGQRADTGSVKNGSEKCVIEASFDISPYDMEAFFITNELEYDPATCILRRELFASGKTRMFVNDSPASLAVVRELGGRLIDIHSQHENLLLSDNRFQTHVVDVMAGNEASLLLYHDEYSRYRSLEKELDAMKGKVSRSREDEAYMRFQLQELDEACLDGGEEERKTLEEEQETLLHAEDIKAALHKIFFLLDDDEGGGLIHIKEALMAAEALARFYPQAAGTVERLDFAYIDLRDLASGLDTLKEKMDTDPERLQVVTSRLDTIYTLEQKHRVTSVAALVDVRDNYRRQLEEMDSFDERVDALTAEIGKSRAALIKQASHISERRKEAALSISSHIVSNLIQLGMPHSSFNIDFRAVTEPAPDGMDEISFLFSANKGGTLEKVARTASGGEISRLMLCVKAMIGGFTALPAIIFDEVDMGVSGDIAHKMGSIMKDLGSKMQVIAITHLPQIASKGVDHYFVYKEDKGDSTVTHIRRLDAAERINEIARMLSGATLTEASVANARELLQSNL